MKTSRFIFCLLATLIAMLSLPRQAVGISAQLELAEFTGDDAFAIINVNDNGGVITAEVLVQVAPNTGDLRGLFLQVIDESILSGLTITGDWVNATAIGDDDVTSVGNANVNGDGSPGPFDVGIEIGTSGIGHNDIQAATFFLNHATMDLSLSMFDLSRWAVRMTSVGLPGGSREGSSKLSVVDIRLTGLEPPEIPEVPELPEDPEGDPPPPFSPVTSMQPIPEPATAGLVMGVAVAGGWYLRRRRTPRA